MRILAISLLFPKGVYPNRGIFVLNRLKAVSRYADVIVINPIAWFPFCSHLERYKDYNRIPRKETIEGIEVYHPRFFSVPLILKFVPALTYFLAVWRVSRKLRRQWKPDLIDLHWTFPDLPAGWWLSRLLGVRQLVTIRGTRALHGKEWGVRRWLVEFFLKRSDFVIALSEPLKEKCLSLGISNERIRVIRNGVDAETFSYRVQHECRRALDLPTDQQILLGIGYLTEHKGFDRVIRSLPGLLKRHPNIHYYVIGPSGTITKGDCTSELTALACQLNVADRVHFVGEVPHQELAKWYGATDVFCLSSRDEGSPNVLSEALACGCPSVTTDVGSAAEILSHSKMGLVVENSFEGVQAGLASALTRTYDRTRISDETRRNDWDWCARQVLEIYNDVLGLSHSDNKQFDNVESVSR